MKVAISTIADVIRTISGVSIVLYLFFLFFFFLKFKTLTMSNKYNIQFCISNLIYSISTIFPDIRANDTFCKFQSALTVFSELNTIAIGTYIVIIAQLNFVNVNTLSKKKSKVFLLSIITSWMFPFIYGLISYFFSGANTISEFCWLNDNYVIYSYIGIRMIYFIVFFYYLYKLIKELRVYHSNINLGELYKQYITRIKQCAIGMIMFAFIFLLYSTLNFFLDFTERDADIYNIFYLFTVIADALSHPIVVLLFVLSKDNINELFCKYKYEELNIDISLTFSKDDE